VVLKHIVIVINFIHRKIVTIQPVRVIPAVSRCFLAGEVPESPLSVRGFRCSPKSGETGMTGVLSTLLAE